MKRTQNMDLMFLSAPDDVNVAVALKLQEDGIPYKSFTVLRELTLMNQKVRVTVEVVPE